MALVTVKGLTAFDFQLRRPRVGAWHADALVEASDPVVGRVDVVIDEGFRTFRGTASQTGEFAETARMRVTAGAGGLGLAAKPRHYNSTSLRIVLGDLLRDAGEHLAASADAGVLGTAIAAWTTPAIPVGAAIAALVAAAAPAGTAWRSLVDGTVWIGTETWPDAGLDASIYEVIDRSFEDGSILVHLDRPSIEPGTTFEGGRVSYVQDDVPQSGPVECRVWFEDDDATSSLARLRDSFMALAAAARPKVDYRLRYWGKVVAQSGRTIDVQPDDPNVPGMGRVRLVLAPGESADGIVGGRVLVSWSGSDLAAYAEGFDGAEHVGKRVIGGDQVFTGGEEGAQPPPLGTSLLTYLTTLSTAINSLGGAVSPPTPDLLATNTRVK